MAGDVLRGFARSPLRDHLGEALEGWRRHFLIRVGVKIGAVALQCMHQHQFRGKLRGGYLMSEKCLEPLPKCGAELHWDCRFSIAD